MKKILYILVAALTFSSCNKFLDVLPDNRAELDTPEEISKILVSAYPANNFAIVCELSSDNIDDHLGDASLYTTLYSEQLAYWKEITASDNENPTSIWRSHYKAIANANQALEAIEKLGNPATLGPMRGEALLCRAYCHFILVNIFCQNYSPLTSDKDMGIPYADKPETTLHPQYDRGTVAQVYQRIEEDLEEGLPLINDAVYSIPKYHFNRAAAYGFASRFYLFYLKYDKVIEYANEVLGSTPLLYMRNWAALSEIARDANTWSQDYVKEGHKANLLLCASYSQAGRVFGAYSSMKRFCVQKSTTSFEILKAKAPWGEYTTSTAPGAGLYTYPVNNIYSASSGFAILMKLPAFFEYTDPVAGTGYSRTVYPMIQTEEVLLNRAEAYTMLGKYDEALHDLKVWQTSRIVGGIELSRKVINDYYNSAEYFDDNPLGIGVEYPSLKKRLSPDFTVAAGEQENFIQCILQVRRLHMIHEGMRWFDVKRYGINVYRRLVDVNEKLVSVQATLPVGDLRRAIQIPNDVISAGLPANPRNE